MDDNSVGNKVMGTEHFSVKDRHCTLVFNADNFIPVDIVCGEQFEIVCIKYLANPGQLTPSATAPVA